MGKNKGVKVLYTYMLKYNVKNNFSIKTLL